MTTKKISFEIPADAYDGVIACLTTNYQPLVPNPAYTGVDQTVPMQIPNPLNREAAAREHIMQYVGGRFEQWAAQAQSAPALSQIHAAVAARKAEVLAATTSTVE